jgi:hypothetical protein
MADDEAALRDVAPEQFVAARDAVVRRLRAGGDKAAAARVAKLRRPALAVWVLNQVARTQPEAVEGLLGAGLELRGAMERALDGDASGLRLARDQERAAVDAVVAAADRRLAEAGFPATDVLHQRMAATLRAAIVDETVAARLRQGALDQEYDAPGFGMDALSAPLTLARAEPRSPVAPSPVAPSPGGPTPGGPTPVAPSPAGPLPVGPLDGPDAAADRARRRSEARREADRLTARAEALVAEADRLALDAGRLTAEAARLAGEANQAGERADQARRQADAAVAAAGAARAEADRLATGDAR